MQCIIVTKIPIKIENEVRKVDKVVSNSVKANEKRNTNWLHQKNRFLGFLSSITFPFTYEHLSSAQSHVLGYISQFSPARLSFPSLTLLSPPSLSNLKLMFNAFPTYITETKV